MGDTAAGLPTLSDVAEAAGVSLATASRVLGGSTYRVSEDLRARVHEAAARLDFVPNAHAQALARSSTSTVGLVVHDVSDPYFSEISRGVLAVASDHDLLVMICNTFRDPERELDYIAALRAQRVRAVVLAGSGFVDPEIEQRTARELRAFAAQGGRLALVGRHEADVDAVTPDNEGGGRLVAEELARLGHRTVGVLAGPAVLTTIEDRVRGFREGLAAAGIELPDGHVRYGEFTREGGYELMDALLEQGPQVTAVFALNDTMAIGALAAAREHGVAVPTDVSVVGFDDITAARDVTPALTTVRVPMEEMGARAATLTLGPTHDQAVTVPLDSELVVRDSTAAPRDEG